LVVIKYAMKNRTQYTSRDILKLLKARKKELIRLHSWLKKYPGNEGDTLLLRRRIARTLSIIESDISVESVSLPDIKKSRQTKEQFDKHFNEHYSYIWENPVRFQDVKRII